MRKIYNLQLALVNTETRLQGTTENGRIIVLNRVVFFNKHSGLLYTTKCGYVVMSFAKQSEYLVNEYINEQLEEIWV